MFKLKIPIIFLFLFFGGTIGYAGNVELTTYYPAPDGDYQTLETTQNTQLSTTNGQSVYIGNYGNPPTLPANVGSSTDSDLFLTGSIGQAGWTNVGNGALLNGWVNWGSPYEIVGYFRDKNGIVHLKGLIKSGAIVAGWPGNQIMTLPAGYIPANRQIFNQNCSDADSVCRVDVYENGQVWVMNSSNNHVSLDGITFRANGY